MKPERSSAEDLQWIGRDPLWLLAEWYRWWDTTDEAPRKMPNGLHLRTLMKLLDAGLIDEEAHVIPPQMGPST